MLEARGIGKRFGATIALQNFTLNIGKGEIVSIVGENGAGKSTLMKTLSGVHQPSEGSLWLDGEEVKFNNPKQAMVKGISMVHQELNLIPTLSVEDNLFLGKEYGSFSVDSKATRTHAIQLLEQVGAQFSPAQMCEDQSIAEQQLVEIAKAVSGNPKLVIFDEPTAVLSDVESQRLFTLIRNLKSKGVSVLYVSHRLTEVLELSDRIVVLRDGNYVTEVAPSEVTPSALADLMVGRKLEDIFPEKVFPKTAGPILELIDVKAGGLKFPGAKGVSFKIAPGDIVGLAGLIGSGRTETFETVVGLRRSLGGIVRVSGLPVKLKNYSEAINAGLAYVSEDRKGRGLVTSMSVQDNLLLAILDRLKTAKDWDSTSSQWIKKLGVKVSDARLPMTSLSGGNQQKVSIAKWLATEPKVLILDEPTRGVDVGAKLEIYKIIAGLAQAGLACVVISSELPELIGLCHRINVVREGEVVGELSGSAMTESQVMQLASGTTESQNAIAGAVGA